MPSESFEEALKKFFYSQFEEVNRFDLGDGFDIEIDFRESSFELGVRNGNTSPIAFRYAFSFLYHGKVIRPALKSLTVADLEATDDISNARSKILKKTINAICSATGSIAPEYVFRGDDAFKEFLNDFFSLTTNYPPTAPLLVATITKAIPDGTEVSVDFVDFLKTNLGKHMNVYEDTDGVLFQVQYYNGQSIGFLKTHKGYVKVKKDKRLIDRKAIADQLQKQ